MIARNSFLEAVSSEQIARLAQRQSLENKKRWIVHYLREECNNLQLEQFYDAYMRRLRISYLILFAIIDLVVVGSHLIALLAPITNLGSKSAYIFIHITCSILMWSTLAVNFRADIVERYPWIMLITSWIAAFIMAMTDTGIAIYNAVTNRRLMIPAHGPYILYAVYIFLPLPDNIHAFELGMAVTVWYLISYGLVTSLKLSYDIDKVITEAIFLLCVNSLGIYFRFMKEINVRIALLDRRRYVEENLSLHYAREKERRLLLSILPEHIVDKIKNHVKSRLKLFMDKKSQLKVRESRAHQTKKSHWRQPELERLFIEPHKDVSIIFADIVNFTYLTTTLNVKTLVETLHELFVKFDLASKEYDVLRIKFVGDCYYAVAGLSPPNEQHAKSCVDFGLHMINIARDVSTSRHLNISIRIGIHSGSILSGVIGARKLQYDIWSKDVAIASRLEQTGAPNRLHVSRETLKQLKGEYMYEDGTPEATEDPLLKKFHIKTYLIESPMEETSNIENQEPFLNTETISLHFMQDDVTSNAFQLQAELEFFCELNKMPLGTIRLKTENYLNRDEVEEQTFQSNLSSMFLFFNWKWEIMFLREPDDTFKYSVAMAAIILFGIIAMQCINQVQYPNAAYTILIVMIICIFLTWFQKLWILLFAETDELLPKNAFVLFLFKVAQQVESSVIARVVIYVAITLMHCLAIFSQLLDCRDWPTYKVDSLTQYKNLHDLARIQKCETTFDAWSITEGLELTICMMVLIPRIPFLIKVLLGILIAIIYSFYIFGSYYTVYKKSPTANYGLPAEYSHIFFIVVTLMSFYIMDRQTEFISKVDFMLRLQLKKQQEDAEIANASVTMLLNNILPSHVADIYISQQITTELYYEEYDNVAVMFANIHNYDIEVVGLRMLNEIICDFDEVLKRFESEAVFKVEKIKLDGQTYMAACGLNFGHYTNHYTRNYRLLDGLKRHFSSSSSETSTDSGSITSKESIKKNKRRSTKSTGQGYMVYVMAQFALKLMQTMQFLITEEKIQYSNHKVGREMLRIGISNGPIMAGVIGSFKPHYDIWGSCVNLASRMESTGIPGYIQVTKNTADILREFNIQCNFRGMTSVKGYGEIPTYFIGIDNDFNFIPHTIRSTKVVIKE